LFIGAFFQINPVNRAHQPEMAPWHPVRIGYAIAAKPLAQVSGFAHIQNRIRCITHQINARTFRRVLEKLLPQPLDQRTWVGE
jgi:hypothetical protein